ncbi:MAG: sugar transferase [Erythrobacter sp.]|nr:sugar transferase [Erythrobacter sp.]
MADKMIITGASGFVGRQIVPILRAKGFDLLLVGREPKRLESLFPGIPNCDYANLAERGSGYDILLHLAVQNNHRNVSAAAFQAANVDLLLSLSKIAAQIGVRRFVNLGSTHAFAGNVDDAYGASKAEGERLLRETSTVPVTAIIAPAIYGTSFQGNLKIVERFPEFLRPLLVKILSLLKPVVSIPRLASIIADEARWYDDKTRSRIVSDDQQDNPVYLFMSRMIDLGVAVALLLLLGGVMIGVAIAIRMKSKGPAIFAQDRVGRDGKVFTCYKFRTMAVGAPQRATHEVGEVMVTDIGKFLRRTKLDELPQLLNLLRNEMSLVGPRPCLPVQRELVERRKAAGVLAIKPGITGLAQIQDIDMSNPQRLVEVETQYLALRTLMLDIKIILATVTGKGQGDRTAVDVQQKHNG